MRKLKHSTTNPKSSNQDSKNKNDNSNKLDESDHENVEKNIKLGSEFFLPLNESGKNSEVGDKDASQKITAPNSQNQESPFIVLSQVSIILIIILRYFS